MAMKLKTEQEIKATWGECEAVTVSILCITYNHEQYLRDAINGFLMQETIYPFEVIIHDDASTDATANIAKEFANLYPNIIKLIIQKENQYSKGEPGSFLGFVFGYASGEYIALCEGDDYWTDPHKLQIQVDEMMSHPECDISFHPATRIEASGMHPPKEICNHANTTLVIPAEQVILNGGSYMPTAALMLKRNIFENMPDWFNRVPFGDYFIQCLASFNAGALYINRVMSVYRVNVPGSWSVNNTYKDKFNENLILQVIVCCHLLDSWSDFRFARAFSARIARYYLSLWQRGIFDLKLLNAFVYASKCIYYSIGGVSWIGRNQGAKKTNPPSGNPRRH